MFDHPAWRARPLATACRLLTCRVRQHVAPLHQAVIGYDAGRARMQVDVTTAFGYTLYRYGHQDVDADLVRVLLAPGDFFIDGGAHVGLMTLVAAARVGPNGKGVAFEPADRTRKALTRNLALSGFTWVEARPEALADTMGTRPFSAFSEEAWGSSSFAPPDGLPGQRVEQTVQVTTLDAVISPADYARLRLVKLDLEGAEYAALRGAGAILRHAAPDLLIELEPDHLRRQGASVEQVTTLLRDLGYAIFRAVPAPDGVALEPLQDVARAGHSPNVYATRDMRRAERAGVRILAAPSGP